MNRAGSRLLLWLLCSAHGIADVPRLPFSGVYGATSGAGSLTGWDRHGGGNPAALGTPGWSASLAGYSPFGLDGLRVLELEASRDVARWGASLGWRALSDNGGSGASAGRMRLAWKPRETLSAGGSLSYRASEGNRGVGAGLGALWRPHAAVSLGAAWEGEPGRFGREHRAGLGADFGARLGRGSAWRVAVERFMGPDGGRETRYGFGLQLHPLLSVYAGLAPRRETVALGVRFGMGGWEGFSALRRHAALGGTSIQGLKWRGEGR